MFFTYKEDGTPEWYTSLAQLEDNILNINMDSNTLLKTNYIPSESPGNVSGMITLMNTEETNILQIDFNEDVNNSAACNDGFERRDNTALAKWQLGSQSGEWCIEPIIAEQNYPQIDFGGTWWGGSIDGGWGISIAFLRDNIVVTIYYYDEDGTPRWVQGVEPGFVIGEPITIEMFEYLGFSRIGQPTELQGTSAGSLTLTLFDNSGDADDGILSVDIRYQNGNDEMSWQRDNISYMLDTLPHNR